MRPLVSSVVHGPQAAIDLIIAPFYSIRSGPRSRTGYMVAHPHWGLDLALTVCRRYALLSSLWSAVDRYSWLFDVMVSGWSIDSAGWDFQNF